MKLDRRVEMLESGADSFARWHFIRTEAGLLEDPDLIWEARENTALTAYGRNRIAPEDNTVFVRFITTFRGDQA